MIVVTLTDCPPALRGYLTKWLQEINTGVYVGRTSSRVRDELWKKVVENTGPGRATMVFNTNNEQGMDFRVHNTNWEPIDFDGLKLILRPSPARLAGKTKPAFLKKGFSNASKYHIARKMREKSRPQNNENINKPGVYVVVDIETTGLSASEHEIIEIAALRVEDNNISDAFQSLVKPGSPVPAHIEKLTGLSTESLANGRSLREVMPEFISFINNSAIVCHNAEFDFAFLNAACERCGLPLFLNKQIDTMKIARKKITRIKNYKLASLLDYFDIKREQSHRGMEECIATQQLYVKLMEI